MIVDASVAIAALMASGTTRHALLHTSEHLTAPAYLREECVRHLDAIAGRARIPRESLAIALQEVLERIQLVPRPVYAARLEEAKGLCRKAAATGDEDSVALALATREPIWRLDKDFDRVKGITRVTKAAM